MALKKPLVITAGQIEQLQAGDTIEHPGLLSRTNANAGTIVIGQAVYASAAGSVDLAQADSGSTTNVVGLVADTTIATTASGAITTSGVLTATTGEWDAVTGDTGGLTTGSKYFLSEATAGGLTTTAPTAGGDYVALIGQALSTTELEINIAQTIRL